MARPPRPLSARASAHRVLGKTRHGIGVKHDRALARKRRECKLAGRLADPDARADARPR